MAEVTAGKVSAARLSKRYARPSQAPVHVLENCSFDIEPGRLTVLIGMISIGLAGYLSTLLVTYAEKRMMPWQR